MHRGKTPKGDSAICKQLTDQVIEMQRNLTSNFIFTIEHVDEDGRKHTAVRLVNSKYLL